MRLRGALFGALIEGGMPPTATQWPRAGNRAADSRIASSSDSLPDRLQVRMSTNGASTNVGATAFDVGDFNNLLLDINPTYETGGYPEAWTQFTVTISGVASGTTGRLAFRYFVEDGGPGGTRSNYIGIDRAVYCGTPGVRVIPTPRPQPTPAPRP